MIFRRFDGVLVVALHSPNRSPDERCRLIEVEDTGGTLRFLASVQARTGTTDTNDPLGSGLLSSALRRTCGNRC